MQRFLGIFVLLTVLVLLFSSVFGAVQSSNNLTWVTISDTTIAANFTASRCMDSTGTQNLNVKVFKMPTGKHDANATVTAIVNEPDGDTNSITFNNQNDGNYAFTYTFDVNGTYKFQINADNNSDVNFSYDLTDYIYVKDFSINISFVNNNTEYSAGDSVTLRNLVVNDDGNAFNDLNTSINVFYPDSSSLHSNEEMTGLGNGEYVFSFIAPSTTGTYSATSVFSCNAESDSNSSGRFTIPAAVIPPAVDPGGGGGSSGGGGGGSSDPDDLLKANITEFKLEPVEIGTPATAFISILNNMVIHRDFLVKMEILRDGRLEFYSEQTIESVPGRQTREAVFAEQWTPKIAGTYIITVTLMSTDKRISYEIETFRYDIEGTFRYDLEVNCSKGSTTTSLPFEFNILAFNLGEYYEDVELSWWVEYKEGGKIGLSSAPIAIEPDKTLEKTVVVFISENVPSGNYTANAKLVFKDFEKTAFCSFTVKSPDKYYEELVAQAEEEITKLEEKLEQQKSQGIDVRDLIERTEELKNKAIDLKLRLAKFDYTGMDKEILEMFAEAGKIKERSEEIERQNAIGFLEGFRTMGIGLLGIFLLSIFLLLYNRKRISKRKGKIKLSFIEKKIEWLLGLEE